MIEYKAFWSYHRQDDADEGGRICELAGLLTAQIRLISASEFKIFVDRDAIGWGDDWEAHIDEALLSTVFLIPIVTPSYFQSDPCRVELLRFSSAATALGLGELIMPIYYATAKELENEAEGSDVASLIRKYQWQEFRQVALEDVGSSIYRKAVRRLAEELVRRIDSADSKPSIDSDVRRDKSASSAVVLSSNKTSLIDPTMPGSVGTEVSEDEELLERLAAGEQAFPRMNETILAIGGVITTLSRDEEESTQELSRSDASGKGFAGRLQVSRRLATKLTLRADDLEPLVDQFVADLIAVDQMVRLAVRLMKESGEVSEAAEFITAITQLAESASPALQSSDESARLLHGIAKWSKDLRGPSTRIERSLHQLSDAKSIFEGWLRDIGQTEGA